MVSLSPMSVNLVLRSLGRRVAPLFRPQCATPLVCARKWALSPGRHGGWLYDEKVTTPGAESDAEEETSCRVFGFDLAVAETPLSTR